jgi:hypothetical protein
MEYIELTTEHLPDARHEWRPLEASDDVNQQVYGQSGSVYTEAIKAGEREYQESSAAYERAMQPTQDTPENREAVAHLKRLMGRR